MRSGTLLLLTGLLHQAVGVILVLGLGPDDDRLGATVLGGMSLNLFWFLSFGFVALMLGGLVRHLEQRSMPVPAWLGWSLIAYGVGGVILLPASGLWLVPPQGAWIVYKARA